MVELKTKCPDHHTKFVDLMDDAGLTQLIDKPTHTTGNILDFMLTKRPAHINRPQVLPGISDHLAVYAELYVKPARRTLLSREVPSYSKADWTGFKEHAKVLAKDIKAAERNSSVAIDNIFSMLSHGLNTGTQTFIPNGN